MTAWRATEVCLGTMIAAAALTPWLLATTALTMPLWAEKVTNNDEHKGRERG